MDSFFHILNIVAWALVVYIQITSMRISIKVMEITLELIRGHIIKLEKEEDGSGKIQQ